MTGTFIAGYGAELVRRTLQHVVMVTGATMLATVIGLVLGISISAHERAARWVIGAASVLFTIPSLALFALLVVVLAPIGQGTGNVPAVTALTLYSILPIVRNTWTALRQVDPSMVQVAQGMGMTSRQALLRVKLPLGLPMIMAGIRHAAVMDVGMGTIATLIGGGGLGYFVFEGIARADRSLVLAGTLVIALLGLGVNAVLLEAENRLVPGRHHGRWRTRD